MPGDDKNKKFKMTGFVSNNYANSIPNMSKYIQDDITNADSLYFYPLHKRLNTYIENKGDENLTDLERKHIRDIGWVTDEFDPLPKDNNFGPPRDDETLDEFYERRLEYYRNKPEPIKRFTKSVENMTDEELGKILNTDFSALKGKSTIEKIGMLFDLRPESISYLDMVRYGKYMMSDDFTKRFFMQLMLSNELRTKDREYRYIDKK